MTWILAFVLLHACCALAETFVFQQGQREMWTAPAAGSIRVRAWVSSCCAGCRHGYWRLFLLFCVPLLVSTMYARLLLSLLHMFSLLHGVYRGKRRRGSCACLVCVVADRALFTCHCPRRHCVAGNSPGGWWGRWLGPGQHVRGWGWRKRGLQ